ncbi:MAG: SemiSWEET transporter [Candidatus Omnitrophota bacterium]|nr:SemiSWEET transporter [Candidatus Omnitrophota bacterium]
MFWKLIGVIAAGLTSFAFIPQVVKMHTTKSAKDISLVTLIQLSLGVSLWMIYGIYLKDYIIILANAVTLLTLLSALFLYYKYRRTA